MKNTALILFLIIALLCISSCDCLQVFNGSVMDASDKKAIKDVHIHISGKSYNGCTTDSSGCFEITDITGGINDCRHLKLVLEKDGYISDTVEVINNSSDTLFMYRVIYK